MNLATAKTILPGISIIKQADGSLFFARTQDEVDLPTVRQQVEAIGYLITAFLASTDNCLVDP